MSGDRQRAARQTGPPDFVGVGAVSSGGQWWHGLLLQHPEVEPRSTRRRELRFFERFCTRPMTGADIAAYHASFPRREGRITGEWGARYMYDAWTPLLLRRAAPEAKLLVMLNDPLERFRRRYALCASDAAGRGRYASQVRALMANFDRDRILVLQYEQCRLDPLGEYARTLRFLGITDDFVPRLEEAPLGRLYARGRRLAGQAKHLLLTRKLISTIELWPDLELSLVLELEREMRDLKELVPGLDLGLWPRFAHLAG